MAWLIWLFVALLIKTDYSNVEPIALWSQLHCGACWLCLLLADCIVGIVEHADRVVQPIVLMEGHVELIGAAGQLHGASCTVWSQLLAHVEPIDCLWSMIGCIAAQYTYNSMLGWPIATHHNLLLSSLIK
jgi:hypothetical protein